MQEITKLRDEELVIKITSKDKELYKELVDRYQKKLMRYITYLISDEEKAADVVQDAFIKAYVNLNGFNTSKKFSSWIYRIAHNEALNLIKKTKKEFSMPDNFDIGGNTNLEEEYSKKELINMVNTCINSIPVKYSEVLVLYYMEEKSYEEISDILRIPMGTVATRLNRGKEWMKKICKR